MAISVVRMWEYIKEKVHLEDLGVNGRIILR
jgi:hypothetical protein